MGARRPPHRRPPLIRSWVEDGVGRVHLDDPEHRNVLSLEHSRAIAAAVAAFNDLGAIVLTAADPVFCSGSVLDLIDPQAPLIDVYAALDALRSSPVVTIAVVTGAAIGAGVNLPLACDIVIAGTIRPLRPPLPRRRRAPRRRPPVPAAATVGRQGAAALSLCGDSAHRARSRTSRAGVALRARRRGRGVGHDAGAPRLRSHDELMARAKAALADQPATLAGGVQPRARGPAVVDGPPGSRTTSTRSATGSRRRRTDVRATLGDTQEAPARAGHGRRRRSGGDHDRGAPTGRRPRRAWAALSDSGLLSLRADGAGTLELVVCAEELAATLSAAPFVGAAVARELWPDAPDRTVAALDGTLAADAWGADRVVAVVDGGLEAGPAAPVGPTADRSRVSARINLAAATSLGPVDTERLERAELVAMLLLAADLVGTREAPALVDAVEHVKGRQQFGVPVGTFQAVQHMAADAHVHLVAARNALWATAWRLDHEGTDVARASVRRTKGLASEAGRVACETACQMFGGVGHTWEHLASVRLRRALMSRSLLGRRERAVGHARRRGAVLLPEGLAGGEGYDLRDDPDEAGFRADLRAWLASPDGRPGEGWHQRLAAGGWVVVSMPTDAGGRALPVTCEAIVTEELGGADRPPPPVIGHLAHALRRVRLARAAGRPPRRDDLGHLPLVPGVLRAGGRLRPGVGAHEGRPRRRRVGRSRAARSGRATPTWPTGSCCCAAPTARATRGCRCWSCPRQHLARGLHDPHRVGLRGVRRGHLRRRAGAGRRRRRPSPARAGRSPCRCSPSSGARPTSAGSPASAAPRPACSPTPVAGDPPDVVRATAWLEALDATVAATLTARAEGTHDTSAGSIDKLLMTWVDQWLHGAALDAGGLDVLVDPGDDLELSTLWARVAGIFGGTSQVQRNIVAQRLLGLPRP